MSRRRTNPDKEMALSHEKLCDDSKVKKCSHDITDFLDVTDNRMKILKRGLWEIDVTRYSDMSIKKALK